MSEWREWSLGALVDAADGHIKTGPFGSQLHAHEYTADPRGIPVVMPKDMVRGRIDQRSVSRVSSETAERLKTHRLAGGDVVLARRGDVGRFAFVEDDESGWLCGTGSMRVHVANHGVVAPRFLRYAMDEPGVSEWLTGQAVGSTMANLNAKIVAALPLSAPDVATQRRIAAVLSAFDELIEINERRIELLEDLARSLYREWFERFRFAGHAETEFVSSELGPIPETWKVRRLGDVATVNKRTLRTSDLPNPLQYLDISSVGVGRLSEPTVIEADRAPGRARRSLRDGDVLWATVRPNRRAHGLVHDPPPDLVASTGLAAISPESVPASFLFLHVSHPVFTEYLVSRATGSAYPAVRPTDFEDASIVVPSVSILGAFDQVAAPSLRLASTLAEHNRALARGRDLLLPRLVTGRLDTSDIDLGELLPPEPA